jgi:hypothetical protein
MAGGVTDFIYARHRGVVTLFDRPGATDINKENGAVPPIGFMPKYVTPTTI